MTEKSWLEGLGGRSIGQLVELEHSHRIDSIVAVVEEGLLAKPELNPSETVVVAVEAMEREVNNGGYEQFLTNSSYQYAPVLVSALKQIGALETASITTRAMNALGASSDWSPEQYEAAVLEATESVLDELGVCDDAYYAVGEAIADKLFEFIKANQADIRL